MRCKRIFAVLLSAALLTGCGGELGHITEETYRRAESFGGGLRDFLPEESSAESSPDPSSEGAESSAEESLPESSGPSEEELRAAYYRSYLTAEQQKEYDALLDALGNRESSARVGISSLESITPVVRALYYDHPEFFWLENGGTLTTVGGRSEYAFRTSAAPSELDGMQAEIDAAAEFFLSQVPPESTECQKVRLVFEFLVDTVDYDSSGPHSGSIYGALVERKARCEGYARAAQYLLGELGVFCTYITGTTLDGDSHGWNLVSIGGEYYHMDPTWGDPSFSGGSDPVPGYRNYAYLCATTDEILLSRTIDETYAPVPSCTAQTHNYFAENGLLLSSYPGEAAKILASHYRSGARFVPLRFADETAYRQALDSLFSGQEIYTLLQEEGITLDTVRYLSDDGFRTITILFS